MDEVGTRLQEAVDNLDGEVSAVHTAVEGAGEKFVALKGELEAALAKAVASGAMTDEEAQALTTKADEVGSHLTEAATELSGDTSAA